MSAKYITTKNKTVIRQSACSWPCSVNSTGEVIWFISLKTQKKTLQSHSIRIMLFKHFNPCL
uniref:Uncharacterized protein n=1 Tax=Anguilla anguilla TaxID=7936 RepID=A0A0E9QML7_ANGAN